MTSDVTTSLPIFLSSNVSSLVSYLHKDRPARRLPTTGSGSGIGVGTGSGTGTSSSSQWTGSGDTLLSPYPFVYNLSDSFQLTEAVKEKFPPASLSTRDVEHHYYDNISSNLVAVFSTANATTDSTQASDTEALNWVRDVALGIVLFFLCLLTFCGNAMVLHAVRTERRLQSVSNMFIVSLAIADLIVGLIVMPISSIYIFTEEWLFGVGVCQFWIGVDYTASTASILNLLILSLDRYWSVTAPLKYLRKRTKRRAAIMISLVWSISSLWLIPIIGWHHFEHGGVRTVPNDVCDTEYATNTALKIITGILNYYLPLAVMYGLYTKIFMEIRKRSKMEIGQRINCGGAREHSLGPTTSLSEDSDERNRQHSADMRTTSLTVDTPLHNGRIKSGYNNHKTEYEDSPLHQRICEGETGTCTETEEEDLASLHKSGYTNLTLVRVASNASQNASRTYANSSDVMSSDSERTQYIYDEGVMDPTTEKIHHFLYEEHALPLIRYNSKSAEPEVNKTDETSLSNNKPDDAMVYSEKDVRFQVSDSKDVAEETLTKFPKEPHPAKNKYVKPRCIRLTADRQDTGSDTTDGVDSNSTLASPRRSLVPPVCRTPSPQPSSRCSSFRQRSPAHHVTSGSFRRQISNSRSPSSAGSYNNHAGSAPASRLSKLLSRKDRGEHNHHNHHPAQQQHHKQHHGKSALIKQAVRWKKKLDKKKHTPSVALHKEIKAARQLGVIMGAFTVCFFPYFVCFMVVAFHEDSVSPQLMTLVTWFGYLNSTLNPFLYPLCNLQFRRKFRKMLRLKVSADDSRRNSKYYAMSSYHRHINSSYDPA